MNYNTKIKEHSIVDRMSEPEYENRLALKLAETRINYGDNIGDNNGFGDAIKAQLDAMPKETLLKKSISDICNLLKVNLNIDSYC